MGAEQGNITDAKERSKSCVRRRQAEMNAERGKATAAKEKSKSCVRRKQAEMVAERGKVTVAKGRSKSCVRNNTAGSRPRNLYLPKMKCIFKVQLSFGLYTAVRNKEQAPRKSR